MWAAGPSVAQSAPGYAARWDTGGVSANWRELGNFLRDHDSPVTLSWERLGQIVAGLPASATNHRAWWSGDRPHVNAWRSAGFRVEHLQPGRSVTLVRAVEAEPTVEAHNIPAPDTARTAHPQPCMSPTILLVTCVKGNARHPAPPRISTRRHSFSRSARTRRHPAYRGSSFRRNMG